MDWNRKQFNSEEEAKKYIDDNVKNYNQVEIKKAMSWKTPEEMFKILNGKEVSCDNRFLEHKTIYKLEAKKWMKYYHLQVTKKKCV